MDRNLYYMRKERWMESSKYSGYNKEGHKANDMPMGRDKCLSHVQNARQGSPLRAELTDSQTRLVSGICPCRRMSPLRIIRNRRCGPRATRFKMRGDWVFALYCNRGRVMVLNNGQREVPAQQPDAGEEKHFTWRRGEGRMITDNQGSRRDR